MRARGRLPGFRRRGPPPRRRRPANRPADAAAATSSTPCGWLGDRSLSSGSAPPSGHELEPTQEPPIPADQILETATRIADALLEVQTRVNGQIDATLAELLPGVQQRLGIGAADDVDLSDLVNARITGMSVVVTPAAVATVVPLSAASAATTRAARRAVTDIVTGADDRLAVIAGPCSIHDPAAALEYAGFLARMRDRHGADLEILMRTYTEKPRTEVDWKGFAYDPFLDGSSRISVGLVATRMLMRRHHRPGGAGRRRAAERAHAAVRQRAGHLQRRRRPQRHRPDRPRAGVRLLVGRRLQELARGQHRGRRSRRS